MRAVHGTDVDAIAVATGARFPDALVASVIGDRLGAPLILTPGGCAVTATRDYLAEAGDPPAIILGTEAAVQEGWSRTACP